MLGSSIFAAPQDTRQSNRRDVLVFLSDSAAGLPSHTVGLGLKEEIRALSHQLTREILVPKDLSECRHHIQVHNPQICHFAGHASKSGMVRSNCPFLGFFLVLVLL